jgi:glutaryl-CoA dehydrogenase (non-decarboxylating)
MGTGKHAAARGSRDLVGTRLIAVDFELTSEQREVQATVRQFVDERILPHAIENDINHHLDMGTIEGMAELGLLGVVIPEEYGGAGLDFVSEALVCEEIERGEAAFRTLISVHVGLNSLTLLRYGDEEQKQRYLVPQARGEKLACFGLTEPAAGSDVAAMLTNARREGDTYVLNGQKNWISYASVAEHALVFAKTDPEAKHRGISAFIVERDRPGVTTADTEHKLGIWAGSTGELFFENVEVPAENLLGEEGQGFEIAMYGLDQGRFTVAAGACGVIRACLEQSVAYARERETFGKPIGKNQFVQDMIAEMVLGYETSKLLVMQAAWLKDKGVRNTRETSLAKWHATESAFRAAHLAIQVHGAYGYSAEYGIERYFRNARAPIIYEGTTQIHKMMQAEHALGYRNLNGRDGDISPLASWGPALLAR